MIIILVILLLNMTVSAEVSDTSALDPETGPAIQGNSHFPLATLTRALQARRPTLPIATPSSPTKATVHMTVCLYRQTVNP